MADGYWWNDVYRELQCRSRSERRGIFLAGRHYEIAPSTISAPIGAGLLSRAFASLFSEEGPSPHVAQLSQLVASGVQALRPHFPLSGV